MKANHFKRRANSRCLKRQQRGATLIEFTLILPALLVLLAGGTLFGLVLVTQQAVTHAAESAADAALAADPDQQDAVFLTQAETLAQARVNQRLSFLPGAAQASLEELPEILDASNNVIAAGRQLRVTVTYPFTNWNLPTGLFLVPDEIVGVGVGTIN